MAAFENKTVLYSVPKFPQQKAPNPIETANQFAFQVK